MSLESLIIKHAKYADLKSNLKRKIGVELSNHKYSEAFEEVFIGKDELSNEDIIYGTCGNHAYEAVKILNRDNDGGYGYDEVLNMYGCEYCIKARKLKIEMGFVGTKLGQIRGAITRVGRKLNNSA
ncbi:MAG: hypothetical protein Unbinned706contig1000_38 [Prokaryotic dsDNA virus sp.]|nr:MAG: hypothetical protein Unbinned706contig1000_38 [Prokaryotic dsDNA virus sp.]